MTTLKSIALELLQRYEESETSVIWEYSGDIDKSEEHLGAEVAKYRELIDKYAEQEPCEDAVSRQAVLDLIEHYNSDGLGSVFYGYEQGVKFADAVNKLPSVRPQEQTGHWIRVTDKTGHLVWECDKCGWQQRFNTHYCPDCGAKMEVRNKE